MKTDMVTALDPSGSEIVRHSSFRMQRFEAFVAHHTKMAAAAVESSAPTKKPFARWLPLSDG
jgi:hypothetical protein